LACAKVYPAVDVVTSRSRLFQANILGDEHVAIAERARKYAPGIVSESRDRATINAAMATAAARNSTSVDPLPPSGEMPNSVSIQPLEGLPCTI
jgi:flagellar biosynthesis/type III secretory pathway ATPase